MPKKTIYVSQETLDRLDVIKTTLLATTIITGEDWISLLKSNSYIFNEGIESINSHAQQKVENIAKFRNTTAENLYEEAFKIAMTIPKDSKND